MNIPIIITLSVLGIPDDILYESIKENKDYIDLFLPSIYIRIIKNNPLMIIGYTNKEYTEEEIENIKDQIIKLLFSKENQFYNFTISEKQNIKNSIFIDIQYNYLAFYSLLNILKEQEENQKKQKQEEHQQKIESIIQTKITNTTKTNLIISKKSFLKKITSLFKNPNL